VDALRCPSRVVDGHGVRRDMFSFANDGRFLNYLPRGWNRALGAVSMLWVTTAIGAGLAFLTQALLARELGPSQYGLFTSSLATVTMVSPLAGFGLSQYWLQVYGVEGWTANRWLTPSLRFISVSTLLTLSVIVLWSFFGAPPDARYTLLLLLPVVLGVLAGNLLSSQQRLEDRHHAMALWQLMTPGSRLLVAVLLLLIPTLAAEFVAFGFGAVSLVVVLLALPRLYTMLQGGMKLHGHGPRPSMVTTDDSPSVRYLWSQAWAYGLQAALYPIFFQISTVLLKYLNGNSQAGIYSVALGVMTAIYLIPATLYQKFLLSKLHRWAVHEPKKFWLVYRHGNNAMLVSGALIGLLLVVVAPWLVPIAFGEKYRPVVKVLVVLAPCVPIRFLSTGVSSALLNEQHMRFRVFAMVACTVLVIALNVLLIPAFHEMGAAVATVIGEASMLLAFYIGVRRFHANRESMR
jgi:O-antigen/teichoic acid export membrane protein